MAALHDEKKQVRKQAAWALGNIGDERALRPLEKALSDEDESVRSAAELAIKAIRMKQASTGTTPDSDS
jgi:HEAT repeat protein